MNIFYTFMSCKICGKEMGSSICEECVVREGGVDSNLEFEPIEGLTESENEELRSLLKDTKNLPRVNGAELSPEEVGLREGAYRTDVGPDGKRRNWCNNFHVLFLDLFYRDYKSLPVASSMEYHRLYTVERTGDKWAEFLKKNQELINKIFNVLERYDHDLILRIRRFKHNIMIDDMRKRAGQPPLLDLVDQKFDSVVGLDCFEMAFWKEFDPLMRQAWIAMEDSGVDPKSVNA